MTNNDQQERDRKTRQDDRKCYNWNWGILGTFFAIVSVLAALNPHSKLGPLLNHRGWGAVIVAIWAIGPPVFFWVDWVYYLQLEPAESDARKIAEHTHDLARNIWLGLLAAVPLLFLKLSNPPKGAAAITGSSCSSGHKIVGRAFCSAAA